LVPWLLAVSFAIVALALFLIPFLIIQPFKSQQADALAFALSLKRIAPWLAAACVIASVLLARRLHRWPAYLFTLLTIVFAAGSFINIFEIMFRPVSSAHFAGANEVTDVDNDDMLLTIKIGGESRAYPVRLLAYHHLINDTHNGVAVVATY
jgi:hypothetical protein